MKSLDTEYETLALDERAPGVVVVTLNRPGRYNAMTNTMFGELETLALGLDHEHDCRVVVLTGAGRAFCSGYDLADAGELPGLGALGMLDQQERAARALLAVRGMRVPVIAAVNGAAAGGGLSLALAADIQFASASAKFDAAFVRIGLSAGDLGASWLLARLIGPAHAGEICFTGRRGAGDRTGQPRQRTGPAAG
jgi:enoyl-CoA hydratase/carnithine racemase